MRVFHFTSRSTLSIHEIQLNTIAPNIAEPNPRISKPSKTPAQIHSTNPLISSENNPNVTIINGKEKNDSTGFNTAFKRPSTIAALSAVVKFRVVIPGNTEAIPTIATLLISQIKSNRIISTSALEDF